MQYLTFIFKNLRLKSIKYFLIILFSISFIEPQDLKKEIQIPFPENLPIDANVGDKKKPETILSNEQTESQKKYIIIPFPDDKIDNTSPDIEFKKIETNPSALPETKNSDASKENQLPLEKLLVIPEIIEPTKDNSKIVESKKEVKTVASQDTAPANELKKESKPVNEISDKKGSEVTKEIGKALVEPSKNSSKEINKDSKIEPTKNGNLYLGEYGKKTKLAPKTKTEEANKVTPVVKDSKSAEVTMERPVTNLPNSDKANKKDKKRADESTAPFERSKYYLNRDDKPAATPELNAASSSDGEKANLAKMDQIRLLALDRRKNEAKNIIEGISDQEFKFKGLYELAVGLENSAKGDKKLQEEAIPFHLTIITEAPKTDKIVPKSLWALSHLLFRIGDHTPALDHLSEIVLKYSNSEFIDDALYLSGRIYEESTSVRNLNRAKKYYQMFLSNANREQFKNSIYLPFVKQRLESLEH